MATEKSRLSMKAPSNEQLENLIAESKTHNLLWIALAVRSMQSGTTWYNGKWRRMLMNLGLGRFERVLQLICGLWAVVAGITGYRHSGSIWDAGLIILGMLLVIIAVPSLLSLYGEKPHT